MCACACSAGFSCPRLAGWPALLTPVTLNFRPFRGSAGRQGVMANILYDVAMGRPVVDAVFTWITVLPITKSRHLRSVGQPRA